MPQFDVVYTWVNGSDPIWKASFEEHLALQRTKNITFSDDKNEKMQQNQSVTVEVPNNVTETDNAASSANRYRDNDELRYSMRSIEKFAPWVRKIFIVTDDQIPNWLRMDHPRVTVVSHRDIFANKSLLPVFSSNAIETQLTNIPGLTRRFLYFNDDVMLGAPVWPQDFLSPVEFNGEFGQKVYFSWEMPKCNEGCLGNWLGDGTCDKACDVERCDFDMGDCTRDKNENQSDENQATSSTTNDSHLRGSSSYRSHRHGYGKSHVDGRRGRSCAPGCPATWIADKTCDKNCNNTACGFDGSDCGVDLLVNAGQPAKSFLADTPFIFDAFDKRYENSTIAEFANLLMTNATIFRDENNSLPMMNETIYGTTIFNNTVVVQIPWETSALYLDLSGMLGPSEYDVYTKEKKNSVTTTTTATPTTTLTITSTSPLTAQNVDEKAKIENNPPPFFHVKEAFHDNADMVMVASVATKFNFLTILFDNNATPAQDGKGDFVQFNVEGICGNLTRRHSFFIQRLAPFDLNVTNADVNVTNASSNRSTMTHSSSSGRKLLARDLYSDSLVTVDMMYRHEWGKPSNNGIRKVPAHMPIMVDRVRVEEMYQRFPDAFKQTAAHKFRSTDDVQFAFAYFHFLLLTAEHVFTDGNGDAKSSSNQEKFRNDSFQRLIEFWQTEIDTDGDGFLSNNEMRTLAAIVAGGSVTPKEIEDIQDCLAPSNSTTTEWIDEDGIHSLNETFRPHILIGNKDKIGFSLDRLRNCTEVISGLQENARRPVLHMIAEDGNRYSYGLKKRNSQVAFEMIGDDFNATQQKLDSVRARKPKFICINDDMENPTDEVLLELHDFYNSFFPKPSSFELPQGRENEILRLDEYFRNEKRRTSKSKSENDFFFNSKE
eukprot:g2576.t1